MSIPAPWLAAAILLLTGFYASVPAPVDSGREIPRLAIPSSLERWNCKAEESPVRGASDIDAFWNGTCSNGDGRLHVFIGYVSSQSAKKRLKSPGLTFRGTQIHSELLNVGAPGSPFRARQIVGQRSTGESEAILYWYQLRGDSFADEYRLRLALLVRRLLNQKTSGLVVRIAAPVTKAGSEPHTFSMERDLARVLRPSVDEVF